MCAAPRAPPPESTRPMRGRVLTAFAFSEVSPKLYGTIVFKKAVRRKMLPAVRQKTGRLPLCFSTFFIRRLSALSFGPTQAGEAAIVVDLQDATRPSSG